MLTNVATLRQHPVLVRVGSNISVRNFIRRTGGRHHMIHRNQMNGHELLPYAPRGMWKMKVIPGDGTIFLPYSDEQVWSVELPNHGATIFVTENLSGCCFCLGRNRAGELVAFHANTHKRSTLQDKAGKAINWQHAEALEELATLINTASVDTGIQTIEYYCDRPEYLECAAKRFGNRDFFGGTTIAGFHDGGQWSFYYQTYGSTDPNGDYLVIECKKFWAGS